MNSPIEALAGWRDHTLTRGQMLRNLISYEYWWLPERRMSDVKAFSRFTLAAAERFPSAEGGQRLYLFSDLDIRESFEATHAGNGGMNFLNPMGWEVFSAELDGVQAVVVDPGSPHELVIGPAEFPEWKALADAVDIEQVWKRLHTSGAEIFPTLAQEPSAGIVLNFNGPSEPMVFAHGVLDLLCAELASPP